MNHTYLFKSLFFIAISFCCITSAIAAGTITSISPATGRIGETITINIIGQGMNFTQDTMTVALSRGSVFNATHVEAISDTLLKATFAFDNTYPTGLYDLSVNGVYSVQGFYLDTNLTSSFITISPNQAQQGENIQVSISGQNTHFGQGTTTVWFSHGTSTIVAEAINVTDIANLSAYFSIPLNASLGYYDVYVNDSIDGQLSSFSGFTVTTNAPYLKAIAPDSAFRGETIDVFISGQNTHFTQGTSTVMFTQGSSTLNVLNTNVLSDLLIQVHLEVPTLAPFGAYNVFVNNNGVDGFITLNQMFTVNRRLSDPFISQITPAQAIQGESIQVSIGGQNTHFGQGTTTVWFSQGTSTIVAEMLNVTDTANISAYFNIPVNASLGYYDINVSDLFDGELYNANAFTISSNFISLKSVTPNDSVHRGETIDVIISGQNTHFTQGTPTVAFIKGASTLNVLSDSILSDLQIKVHLEVPALAPFGAYDVMVNNYGGDGLLILNKAFAIEPRISDPLISQLTPVQGGQGEHIQVSISGQNTHFGQGTTTVWFSQGTSTIVADVVNVTDTTHLSANFILPFDAETGLYDVSTINETDGEISKYNAFTILETLPVLTAISPDSALQGQVIDVTLSGQNTHFTQGTNTVSFMQGSSTINATSVTVLSDLQLKAHMVVPSTAPVGIYDVKVNNLSQVTLNLNQKFTVNTNCNYTLSLKDQSICSGGVAALSVGTVISGATYTWFPSAGLSSTSGTTVTASALMNSTYFVKMQKGICFAYDSVNVIVNPLPQITANVNKSICAGDSAHLMAAGGVSYIWNTQLTSKEIIVNPAINTNYTVSGTDANGCSNKAMVSVLVIPSPRADAGPDQDICLNAMTTLTASGGTSYSWSNGFYGASIAVSPQNTATYTVTVVDNNNCKAASTVRVRVNSIPVLNITKTDASCGQSTGTALAAATGGAAPYLYLWNNASTKAAVSGLSAMGYMVTVTDTNGCQAKGIANIGNTNGPSVSNISATSTTCASMCDGTSTIVVEGGSAPYTYSWNTNPNQTDAKAIGLCTKNYAVTATDASGCKVSGAVQLGTLGADPSISGVIRIGAEPITSGAVGLYRFGTARALELVVSAPVSSTGTYSLPYFKEGDYLIAAEADTALYPFSIKTYYIAKSKWTLADTIQAPCNSTNVIDIALIDLTPMNGNATIGGAVKDLTGGKTFAAGDPIPGVDVSLEQIPGGIVKAQTKTDEKGNFKFEHVEVGDFQIFVDMPGLDMAATHNIEVTPADTVFKEANFWVDSTGTIDTVIQAISGMTRLQAISNSILKTYPNPYTDATNIEYNLLSKSAVSLEVYNILGKRISVIEQGTQMTGSYKYRFSAKDLGYSPGIYIIKLSIDGAVLTQRIVEQN